MQANKYQDRFQTKFAEIQQIKAISPGWHEVTHGKSLKQFSLKYFDNEIKLGKIVGTITAPFEKAEKYYFECFDAQKHCRQEMCEEFKCLEAIDGDTNVVLLRTKSKGVVSSREIIGAQQKLKISETETAIIRINLDEGHPSVPVQKDVVRGEIIIQATFLKKVSDTETAIEAYFLVKPKGNIPVILANTLSEQELQFYENDIAAINSI